MGEALNPPPAPVGETLKQKLLAIIDKVEILQVTTAIATISAGQVTEGPNGLDISYTATLTDVASVTLDTVLGDLKTNHSTKFAEDAGYAKLHDDSVALARAVRQETIDLIIKAIGAAEALLKLG